MRNAMRVASIAAMVCLSMPLFAKTAATVKNGAGTIVIVFKDGHRQSFNLSDILRVEFPGGEEASAAVSANAQGPSRAHFIGKWEVGEGNGQRFFITIEESGDAHRTLGNVHGRWIYEDGEARITWDDGAHDAIRKVGSKHQKAAFGAGKSFTDAPDNVTGAVNTTPHPI